MAHVRPFLVVALVFNFVPVSHAQSVAGKLPARSFETANHQNVAPKTTAAAPRIAFGSSRDNGNHDIYTMEADGTNEIRLTTGASYDDQPAWSPDGSTIAFMTDRDGNFEIYTMPGTGGTATRLTNNPAGDGFPSYSPDGSKIVFVRGDLRDPSTFEIWVMNANGSNQVRLTNDSNIDGVPTWAPAGNEIVFMSGGSSVFDPNSFEIYLMDADGSNRTRLTNNNIVDGQPMFSPDGMRILFASGDAMSPQGIEIYVMNANGSNRVQLTNNTVTDGFPVWSPDGSSIVFARGSISDEKGVELYRMNSDGSGQTRLTTNASLDWFPSWQRIEPPPTTIQLSSANFSATEGNNNTSFKVTRSGNTASTATVLYSTSDDSGANECNAVTGIASERCDYETAAGTLTFAPGETEKTVFVTLVEDVFAEGNETFKVNLLVASGSGVSLGSPTTATVTIADNDLTNGATNPLDNSDAVFFVRQHYIDFLNREPDSSGLAFWTDQITSCGSDTQCREIRRINVSAAFFLSIEFQETGYLVYRTYKVAYNPPGIPVPVRYNNFEFIPDTQQLARGVIIGQPGAEQQLEANKQAFFAEFVLRLRFTQNHPTSKTPAQFVDDLYANAGIVPTAAERQFAIAEFGGATNTIDTAARARVLRRIADDSRLRELEKNKAFVLMEYFGYLRRNPFDPPEATLDFQGYNFWLNKLNQFNGNFVNAEMVKAFIISGEYRHRFGP
jgi:Tol biopolymer transport system component